MDYHKLNFDQYGVDLYTVQKTKSKFDFLDKLDNVISEFNFKNYRSDLFEFVNNSTDPFISYMNCHLLVLAFEMYKILSEDENKKIEIFQKLSKQLDPNNKSSNLDLLRYYYYIKKNIEE